MSIRYVDRWADVVSLNPDPGVDCFSFRIDSADDFEDLPTPVVAGTVVEGSGTVSVFAAIGSDVISQDQSIVGELQSDGAWHQLGGT